MTNPKDLTLNEYQQLAGRTASTTSSSLEDLEHGVMGLVTEAGELTDAFKRHRFYGKELDIDNIREELGDLLWYLALAAHGTGLSLGAIADMNIRKLKARYPEGFTQEAALNRDIEAEQEAMTPRESLAEDW